MSTNRNAYVWAVRLLMWLAASLTSALTLFVDLPMIAKYFERIGDHCTNIAEWVEFSVTGMYKDCQ